MTGTAVITRHVTQQCSIPIDNFRDLPEARRIAFEAADNIRHWEEVNPEVYVEIKVMGSDA